MTWITIASDRLTAAINPLGAELSSLTDAAGRELMTNADPAFWAGRAPLLFPVVGRCHDDMIRLSDAEYPMPKHGFARRMTFDVVEQAADRATLRLRANAETERAYPFPFELDAAFALAGARLTTAVTVRALGEGAMPASFGFHPAFAWPLPYGRARADHRIVFEQDEPARLSAISDAGTIAAETRPSPLDGRTLHLADALFERDALVWDTIESSSLAYGAGDGPQLRIAFPDTPKLGIWSKPGAAYVCVEPWHGIADPEGYTGDFLAKPGVFDVPPGGEKTMSMSVTLEA